MSELIPLAEPYIAPGGYERRYLIEALNHGDLSRGAYLDDLEQLFAQRTGKRHAVAMSSGTAALHVALLVAGIGPSDKVACSDLTFVASANVIRYCGAEPVLIDAESDYWQTDPDWIDAVPCKAQVAVDLYGHPHDAEQTLPLMIEDATEALGACYRGKPVGALADIACYSLNANKLISGGGGGILATDNPVYARHARKLIDQAKDSSDELSHNEIGFNYRYDNLRAAVAVAQFERLAWRLERKRAIAARYAEALADLPGITLMPKAPWAEPSYWLYSILTPGNSRPLIKALADENIQARPFFKPLHLQKPYADCQVLGGEVAVGLWTRGTNLPSSVGLTVAQQDRVIDVIRRSWAEVTA